MEILSFMLGVSAVLIVLGVVFMFGMSKKIKQLNEKLNTTINVQNDIFKIIEDNHKEVKQTIFIEISETNNKFRELERELGQKEGHIYRAFSSEVENIRREIDSRLDKFENKLKSKKTLEVIN